MTEGQPERITTVAPVRADETGETTAPQEQRPEDGPRRPKSPEEFYREITARADVRAFLKRLADR